MTTPTSEREPQLRILSVDGGGVRGLLAASVLREVEQLLQERRGPDARLAEHVDLVAGTSVGGIIVGLLTLPDRNARLATDSGPPRPAMTAADVVDFLLEYSPRMFERRPIQMLKRVGGLVDERYSLDGFNAALDAGLGARGSEPSLSELLRPTVIPTFLAGEGRPYFFKQHTARAGGRDFSLHDVALATAAAPTYFEPAFVRSDRDELGACVDGGLFANNPAMCAYSEAQSHFGHGADRIALLSVGTGSVTHRYEYEHMRGWGAASWMPPIFQMLYSGSAVAVDHQLRQIFRSDAESSRYLRLQADLTREAKATSRTDNIRPANLRRLVDIGRELAHRHRDDIERFLDAYIVDRPVVHPNPTVVRIAADRPRRQPDEPTATRELSRTDRWKIDALTWIRHRNQETVEFSGVDEFRRRHIPTSGMPRLVCAAAKYPDMAWAPAALMVPEKLPRESIPPKSYLYRYYWLAANTFKLYRRNPIDPDVPWQPDQPWNHQFPPTGDGWEHPTSDETFVRLRLQGPNPWGLRRIDDADDGTPMFQLDLTRIFDGVLPPIRARFALRDGELRPDEIDVGSHTHRPGDATWDRAKRVVNAADARYVTFGLHLLETHLVVGEAFALAAYQLPIWHRLRPFMQFFTYATLPVNHVAYRSLLGRNSYFVLSGFIDAPAAERLFHNLVADFDLGRWQPLADLDERGVGAIPGHPYDADARLIWPEFEEVVDRHLRDLELDDETIADDADLQQWYLTLAKLLPNESTRERLDRRRLATLCTSLLWNNVVHEIAGDLSPILMSEDPADKATIDLAALREAVGDGALTNEFPTPSAAAVFLIDQASFVSRFNVGGNNILAINAARVVDDPRLRAAIEDLQATLRELEQQLLARNERREVRFARMLPRHWEASISF